MRAKNNEKNKKLILKRRKTDRICRNHCLSDRPFIVAVVGRAEYFHRCQKLFETSFCRNFGYSIKNWTERCKKINKFISSYFLFFYWWGGLNEMKHVIFLFFGTFLLNIVNFFLTNVLENLARFQMTDSVPSLCCFIFRDFTPPSC